MVGVQNAVQNGIDNLSKTSINVNAMPGDEYRFRARNREELIQSEGLAANSGGVRAGRPALDPAATELHAPALSDDDEPAPSPKAAEPKGWLL